MKSFSECVIVCGWGGEESHRVNIGFMCVVCAEDIKGQGCFILILWIRRVLDILIALELDSQSKPERYRETQMISVPVNL